MAKDNDEEPPVGPPGPPLLEPVERKIIWLQEITRSGMVLILLAVISSIFFVTLSSPPDDGRKEIWNLIKMVEAGLLPLLGTAIAFYFTREKR